MKKLFLSLLIMTMSLTLGMAQSAKVGTIDLSGKWQFRIDRDDAGEKEGWYKPDFKFAETVKLPGSMTENLKGDDVSLTTQWVGALYDSSYYFNPKMAKYRIDGQLKFPFFLTPAKHYVGKAWYKRTITMPEFDQNSAASWDLFLERPHIITKIWVNGQLVGEETAAPTNSLSVPHIHNIAGLLHPGENTIAICVDNDPVKVNVGKDSHSVTDQTQGCWNGIVGKMELRQHSDIKLIKVYPDIDTRIAKVSVFFDENCKESKAIIALKATAFNTKNQHEVSALPQDVTITPGQAVDLELKMGEGMLLWDEFNPQLYKLSVEVATKAPAKKKKKADVIVKTETEETVFGMRKIEIRGKMFFLNGTKIHLRGNVENCVFPLTGYPPTDLDSWVKVFSRCKEFGLNHMRFHSYCPPEAAFLAADLTGFYLQPEGPSWPNHGVKLGNGEYIDTYLLDETKAICDIYGNHPCFTFYSFGNEPAGNWVEWCNKSVLAMKDYDTRHIYPGFSVGGGWAWQPKSEFAVKAGARGLNEWTSRAPESVINFKANISMYNGKDMPGTPITIPFVTHEMGQWCVFPNLDENVKYTGINKAYNFEIFRDLLHDAGMGNREKEFLMASGKLQALCYKYEMERVLRTPDYAGFQILSINDYTGQGSALVGVTDAFYDDKGYFTAKDFREFCAPVVPLAKIEKFTYTNAETFVADVELAQFSNSVIKNANPHWTITRESDNKIFAEGNLGAKDLAIGQNIELGKISVSLANVQNPGKYTLTVTIPGTEAKNHWDFWVYQDKLAQTAINKKGMAGNVYVTDTLDANAIKILKKGGNVLICAAGKVKYGNDIVQHFLPVFWNTSWFKMRPPHTTGIYVENEHPVFNNFPTDYHSDLQWWELVNKAQVMQFDEFDASFQPLVQSIDTWFISRKIGMLFEAKMFKGKVMMTTMDITSDLDNRIVARQMRESILSYMNSSEFNPSNTIVAEQIEHLFTREAPKVNMFTKDTPDELKPALKPAGK